MKKIIVDVRDGRKFEGFVVQPAPSSWNPNPSPVFYSPREIKANGQPDKRCRPSVLGVRRTAYRNELSGWFAILDPAREAAADAARAEVRRLEDALANAKQALLAVYAAEVAPAAPEKVETVSQRARRIVAAGGAR